LTFLSIILYNTDKDVQAKKQYQKDKQTRQSMREFRNKEGNAGKTSLFEKYIQ